MNNNATHVISESIIIYNDVLNNKFKLIFAHIQRLRCKTIRYQIQFTRHIANNNIYKNTYITLSITMYLA